MIVLLLVALTSVLVRGVAVTARDRSGETAGTGASVPSVRFRGLTSLAVAACAAAYVALTWQVGDVTLPGPHIVDTAFGLPSARA